MNLNSSGGALVPHLSSNETNDASVELEFVNVDMLNVNRSFSGKQYKNNKLNGSTIKNRTSFKYFANIKQDPLDYQVTDTLVTDTSLQSETVLVDDESKVFRTVPVLKDCRCEIFNSSSGEKYFVPQSVDASDSVQESCSCAITDAGNQLMLVENNQTTNEITSLYAEQDGYKEKLGHSPLLKPIGKPQNLEYNMNDHIEHVVIPNCSSAQSEEVDKETEFLFLYGENCSGRIKITSQEITPQNNVMNSNDKPLQEVPPLKVYKNKKLKSSLQTKFIASQIVCPSEIEHKKFTYTREVNIASNDENQLMLEGNSESKTITKLLTEQQINTVSSDFLPSQEVFGTTLEFKDEIKGDVEQIIIPDFTSLPSYEVHNKNDLCLANDFGSISMKENKKINSTKNDPFLCSICGKQFRLKKSLLSHSRTHGEKSFLCSECGKKFFTKTLLNKHMRVHTGERPYKCSICSRSFSCHSNFKRHMQLHSTVKQFQCQVCEKRFFQKQCFVRHLEKHDKCNFKFNKDRKCSICQVSLKELNCPFSLHLEEHRRKGEKSVNGNRPTQSKKKWTQPSQCYICGKIFSWEVNLTMHLYTHNNDKRFKCSICKKGFNHPTNLKRHTYLHKSKQFVCNFCGRMCSQLQGLIFHLRTHTGEKPYQCAICKRDFSDNRSLTRHLNLHSEQRLYECADCGKSFYHKISLINHIQFQHSKR